MSEVLRISNAGVSEDGALARRDGSARETAKFKIDSNLGTIEPGKTANLVLLKKSPLESLAAYDSIVTVWIHGKPASRDSLVVSSNR